MSVTVRCPPHPVCQTLTEFSKYLLLGQWLCNLPVPSLSKHSSSLNNFLFKNLLDKPTLGLQKRWNCVTCQTLAFNSCYRGWCHIASKSSNWLSGLSPLGFHRLVATLFKVKNLYITITANNRAVPYLSVPLNAINPPERFVSLCCPSPGRETRKPLPWVRPRPSVFSLPTATVQRHWRHFGSTARKA